MSPPVLASPIQGKTLILFVVEHEQSVGALLAQENEEDIRPPWKIYFDDMLPYSFMLSQKCSNNVEKYQALILGLEVAAELDIPQLEVYGDSQLVINQLMGEYEVRKQEKMNKQADALAGLASSIAYPRKKMSIPVF
ncbi:hypothetical protein LIER_19407 [Lithospermum erythrorhizon]|uniref:RNase H type-1 domain-containing protein n=1 Tax=Lithospermum erythrorhizon TaxID=34254 RepID=A0AAV3QKL7_LITER